MEPVKGRILFAEDHEDTRDLMVLVFGQSNYDVVTAPSIAGALKLVEAGTFDLFVLDSFLIDGTGIELCKCIRVIDPLTPILFYSALAYEKDKEEAFSSGAQQYLVKPVSIPVLCQTVAELIRAPCESDERLDGGKGTYQAAGRIIPLDMLESKKGRTVPLTAISNNPRNRSNDIAVAANRRGLKTMKGRTAA
jgi:DNA-binding response OmpR family regulator